jgi:phage protein U
VIGSLGDVVFTASSELVRTFADLAHKTAGRWTAHEVIGQKPAQEFGGAALRTLSLSIRLDVDLGVDPETEAAALRTSVETGEVLALLLDGEPRGDWVCKELGETWRHVDANGRARVIDLSLALEEYA